MFFKLPAVFHIFSKDLFGIEYRRFVEVLHKEVYMFKI